MQDLTMRPGVRIAAFTLAAFSCVSRGAAYMGNAPNTGLTTFVDTLVPLPVWGTVWILAGLFIFAGIWHRVVARVALSLGASLWTVWALSYLIGMAFGGSSRGWVTSTAMISLAGMLLVIEILAEGTGPPEGSITEPSSGPVRGEP